MQVRGIRNNIIPSMCCGEKKRGEGNEWTFLVYEASDGQYPTKAVALTETEIA